MAPDNRTPSLRGQKCKLKVSRARAFWRPGVNPSRASLGHWWLWQPQATSRASHSRVCGRGLAAASLANTSPLAFSEDPALTSARPDPGCSHPELLDLVTSVKTLSPNKATSRAPGTRRGHSCPGGTSPRHHAARGQRRPGLRHVRATPTVKLHWPVAGQTAQARPPCERGTPPHAGGQGALGGSEG